MARPKRNTRQTGPRAATYTGRVLRNPKSTKAEKAAAAGALTPIPRRTPNRRRTLSCPSPTTTMPVSSTAQSMLQGHGSCVLADCSKL